MEQEGTKTTDNKQSSKRQTQTNINTTRIVFRIYFHTHSSPSSSVHVSSQPQHPKKLAPSHHITTLLITQIRIINNHP